MTICAFLHALCRQAQNYSNTNQIYLQKTHYFEKINSNLQLFIEQLYDGKQGAVICMNPLSGQILAYLSAPDYDLNSFVGPVPRAIWDAWNKDEGHPLLNRVIQGLYPTGSTMKLIAAALALEQRTVSEKWKVKLSCVFL